MVRRRQHGCVPAPARFGWWVAAGGLWLLGCGAHRLQTLEEAAAEATGGSGPVASGGAGAGAVSAGGGGARNLEPLITLDDFSQFQATGQPQVQLERFGVGKGQPFTEAWRATMLEAHSNPWVAQLVMPLNKPVRAGATLHVSFWVSWEAQGPTGDCYTEYIFERNGDPWEKSVTLPGRAEAGWVQTVGDFTALESYEAGASHMVFRLGYPAQVIAIGGLELSAVTP